MTLERLRRVSYFSVPCIGDQRVWIDQAFLTPVIEKTQTSAKNFTKTQALVEKNSRKTQI